MANAINMSSDLAGDRSSLALPYEVFPLVFRYVAASDVWVLNQTELTLLDAGVGDETSPNFVPAAGQTIDEGITSLLKGGFITAEDYFTMLGVGFEIEGPPMAIESSPADTGSKVDFSSATTTLLIRRDTEALTAQLVRAALNFSEMEFLKDGRTCSTLLGSPTAYPSGVGFSGESVGPSNGLPLPAARRCFRRPLVCSPQTNSNAGEIIKLKFKHPGQVNFDPAFPEPTNLDNVAVMIRATYYGYVSDKNGNVVTSLLDASKADQIETAIAESFLQQI